MNRLLEIGFEPAGHWLLEGSSLRYELIRHSSQSNILYAFVCDGEVMYVGKTVRMLAVRMANYRTPGKSQTTNIKNHRRMRELLASGSAVEILALPDNGLMHYGKFHLNLAAALEDDIIRRLDPPWNGGKPEQVVGKSSTDEVVALTESLAVSPKVFSFVLQPTYFRTGFFNVATAEQAHLGADGETIELFLDAEPQPVLGMINRRANANGTPRVLGGPALREWLRTSAAVKDRITVDVLSPTSVRLRRSAE